MADWLTPKSLAATFRVVFCKNNAEFWVQITVSAVLLFTFSSSCLMRSNLCPRLSRVFGGMALTEEMVSEGKITQNNCKKRKCEVTQMKENGHISAASEWGEREANVGHLPVLCLSSRSSPVGGHLPAPTCVTVTTSSHCSGLVARFNLKIVFDSRADFRFCSKWNPFILGIFDLRDVRFSGFYCSANGAPINLRHTIGQGRNPTASYAPSLCRKRANKQRSRLVSSRFHPLTYRWKEKKLILILQNGRWKSNCFGQICSMPEKHNKLFWRD